MSDHLAPTAETWSRPTRRLTIDEHPEYWRSLAAAERDSRKADEYRQLAATLERYLPIRGRVPCSE